MPRAEGEGRRVVAARAASRARARAAWCASSRREAAERRARSSSTAPATRSCARRTGRSSRRSISSRRVDRSGRAARGARDRRRRAARALLPDLPARVGELPPARRGRPRHRAPPPPHSGDRPPRPAVSRRPPGAARASRTGTGRTPRRCSLLRHLGARRRRCARAPARHLPRHGGRRAGDALGDARRPAPVRRRRAAAARRALGRGGRRVRAPRRRRRRRRRAAPSSPRRSATSPRATRSSSASCGAPWSRPGRRGRRRHDRGSTAAAEPSSARPRASARSSAERLSRLAPTTTDLLELAAAAGAGVRARRACARAAGSQSPSSLAALDEAVRSGMIEEVPAPPARLPVHARARAHGPLYDRLTRRAAGRAPPCASARRSKARTTDRPGPRRSPTSPTTSRPPRRSAERSAAVDYNVARGPRGAVSALAFDEARGAAPHGASSSGIDDPRRAGRGVQLELGTASHRAGKATRRARGLRAPRRRSPASSADAELLARAAIGYEDACWRPGHRRSAARSSCSRRRPPRSATRAPSCASRLLGGLARALDFAGRPRARRDRPRERRRDGPAARRPARPRDRADARLLVARDELARGDPRDAHRGRATSAEELGDTEIRAEAMAWRVPALVGARRRRHRAARGRRRCSRRREQTAQPFMLHVAEHYGSAIALGDGHLAEAEAAAERSHEWSRLLTGRDRVRRLRHPDVQRPPRAGASGGARPGGQDPGRRVPGRGARGDRASVTLLVELGMDAEARRELAPGRRRWARPASARRSGSASLTYLTDACAALGDEATAALVYPELEPFAGRQRDDRPPASPATGQPTVTWACSPRRSASGSARRSTSSAAMELNRRMGARDLARPHRVRVRAHAARPRPRGERDRAAALLGEAAALAEQIGMPALLARASRRSDRLPPPAALPDGLSPREVADPGARRAGHRATVRSASTLDHQRAHGRQPRPQHPAQDRLREPHRGRLVRPSPRPHRDTLRRT